MPEYNSRSVRLDDECWETLRKHPLSANKLLRIALGLDGAIAGNHVSHETANPAITPSAEPARAFDPATVPGVQRGVSPTLAHCYHCEEDYEPIPGAPPSSMCRKCAASGHRDEQNCRKCAERKFYDKKAAKSTAADTSDIDFTAFND